MNVLMCPVCGDKLALNQMTWRCTQGHSYDVAKQGYVNLHVVQHKHSKSPGDTPESVQARRAFLSEGFYQPLRDALEAELANLNPKYLLDIGCGEGYYTDAMQQHVKHCIGLDIAKTAVQRAAKLNRQVTWVVGTGAVLPVLDQSIDVCTSLFSPIPQKEILRVLQPEGYLMVATPAPQHLLGMRAALFDEVNPHTPEKFVEQLQHDFELVKSVSVESTFDLNQTQLKHLIAMTPYAYKAKAEKREVLEAQEGMHLTASFQLYLFKVRKKQPSI